MRFQRKIDFQAHYLPPSCYDFLAEEGPSCPDGFPTPPWDEAWQQEMMGELGIAYALLSISSPSLWTKDPARTRTLARKVNEEGAEIVSRSPCSLGFLATLPLPEVSAAIDEARYCLDALHAAGAGLMIHYGGVYLGGPLPGPPARGAQRPGRSRRPAPHEARGDGAERQRGDPRPGL